MRVTVFWAGLAALAFSLPVIAKPQVDPAPKDAGESDTEDPDRVVIDLLAEPLAKPSFDAALARQCEEERDAAVISGEIVVCRKLGDDAEVSGVDSEAAKRRYAERTQGPSTPDVEGAGGSILYRTEGSVFMVTVKTKTGDPPPPALIIDVEALPEAPEGADADRVGKGLPAEGASGP